MPKTKPLLTVCAAALLSITASIIPNAAMAVCQPFTGTFGSGFDPDLGESGQACFIPDPSGGGTGGGTGLTADSVGSPEIIDGAVSVVDLNQDVIDLIDAAGGPPDDDSVDAAAIQTDAVGSDEIAADAVGSDEIATDAVGSDELADDSVDAAAIQTDAVGSDEIVTDAVGADELADDAVDTAAIQNEAVTTEKIADNSVTVRKLGGDVIEHIAAGDRATLRSANEYTDNAIAGVTASIGHNRDIASDGIAIALASKAPTLPAGANQAITMGFGHYDGRTAFAGGFTARVAPRSQLYGTVGIGFNTGKVGLSAGYQLSW